MGRAFPKSYVIPRLGLETRIAVHDLSELRDLRTELELLRMIDRHVDLLGGTVAVMPEKYEEGDRHELALILLDARNHLVKRAVQLVDQQYGQIRKGILMSAVNDEAERIAHEAIESGAVDQVGNAKESSEDAKAQDADESAIDKADEIAESIDDVLAAAEADLGDLAEELGEGSLTEDIDADVAEAVEGDVTGSAPEEEDSSEVAFQDSGEAVAEQSQSVDDMLAAEGGQSLEEEAADIADALESISESTIADELGQSTAEEETANVDEQPVAEANEIAQLDDTMADVGEETMEELATEEAIVEEAIEEEAAEDAESAQMEAELPQEECVEEAQESCEEMTADQIADSLEEDLGDWQESAVEEPAVEESVIEEPVVDEVSAEEVAAEEAVVEENLEAAASAETMGSFDFEEVSKQAGVAVEQIEDGIRKLSSLLKDEFGARTEQIGELVEGAKRAQREMAESREEVQAMLDEVKRMREECQIASDDAAVARREANLFRQDTKRVKERAEASAEAAELAADQASKDREHCKKPPQDNVD